MTFNEVAEGKIWAKASESEAVAVKSLLSPREYLERLRAEGSEESTREPIYFYNNGF